MKTFHCTNCQSLVFFENVRCLNCERALAYLPDRGSMSALEQGADGLWRSALPGLADEAYRLCANYAQDNCNWAVPIADSEPLCQSCRLTQVIPNLSNDVNKTAWFKLERAKRRMVYTLLGLELPVVPKTIDPSSGLAFELLEDSAEQDDARVLTGHDEGLITVNIAEADDVHREMQRTKQHEPYRTLLGHFRHEIGHYYWDRLILNTPRLEGFRSLFGDERADYQKALEVHYREGPPQQWERQFISAYATTHPWEDWAESWAHFLHMMDALETAGAAGLTLKPKRADEPSMRVPASPLRSGKKDFDRMIAAWIPLTYVLNNLSRGLGLADTYPFLLSAPVVEKLRFIHDTVNDFRSATAKRARAVARRKKVPRASKMPKLLGLRPQRRT